MYIICITMKKKKNEREDPQEPQGIFLPVHRKLGSCMTHRPDIVWIEAKQKKEEILALVKEHQDVAFFPVCADTIDSVLGVLSARTFLESLFEPSWSGLKKLVKKPVYLPETVTILKALSFIVEAECHMAFIIDEYGGIEGIVTKNSLVEELLEEVSGEKDDDPDIFHREDGSWLVGGHVRIDDLATVFDFPAVDNNHDYYTLAGYLLSLKGSIPHTGDLIRTGKYTCEIVDMDGHRIDKVLVSEQPVKDAEE